MTLNSLEKYGTKFCTKVLNTLCKNAEFLATVHDILDINLFPNQSHQWVLKKILDYYEKFNTCPTLDYFVVESKKIEYEILQLSVVESIKEIYRTENSDEEYIQEEFLNFSRNQVVKKAIMTSIDLLQAGDFDAIRNLISTAVKAGERKSIGHQYEKDVEVRYREDDRKPIPFPWEAFNDITQGGYGKGDLVILFGSPKGGKSWVAVAMAMFAVALGYNVVYYTLELGDTYVGRRMDANLSKIPVDKVQLHRAEIDKLVAGLKGKLVIQEYAQKRASLTTIENHLDQLENQHDFKADAVFIDYLDLLKNRNTSRKEIKDDLDDIYSDARGMARERKIPVISPSQINRAGAKDKVIEGDKIAGSYNKFMVADILISLSRLRKDKLEGTGRFHVLGNRYGRDGVTYIAKLDLSNGNIDISNKAVDIDEDEVNIPRYQNNNIGTDEKSELKEKYFEFFPPEAKI